MKLITVNQIAEMTNLSTHRLYEIIRLGLP